MPIAVPQRRGNVHGLRAIVARVHQFDAVRAGELQGQVRVLLASGSEAEHRPLSQPLKPEMNSLMDPRFSRPTRLHEPTGGFCEWISG